MDEIILGFDYGVKNIGIAVGNRLTNTAQPVTILRSIQEKPDFEKIAELIKEWQPSALVVGIPYTADGTATPHINRIRNFMKTLNKHFHLPVYEVDEKNTSIESTQYIKPSKKHKKGQLDAHAAALIVERYLNEDFF